MYIVISGPNPTQQIHKLIRYFNIIELAFRVLWGGAIPDTGSKSPLGGPVENFRGETADRLQPNARRVSAGAPERAEHDDGQAMLRRGTDLLVPAASPNQEKFLRLYSEKVVPKLRAASADRISDRCVYRELNLEDGREER
jgi:hypothetical protein